MALTNEKPLASHITAGTEDGFLTTAGVIKDENENQSVQDTLNSKYTKPSTGIPKTDLSSDVQTSLGKADTAIQPEDLEGKQDKLTLENAGANITIAEESGVLKISAENTNDYDQLIHKPAISGTEITKDSTAESLGLATISQVNSKQTKIDEDHKVSADYINDLVSEKKLVTFEEKNTWSGKQDELNSDNAGDGISITKEGEVVKISVSTEIEGSVKDVLVDDTTVVNPVDKIARIYTDPALTSAKETGGIGYQEDGTTHKINYNYINSGDSATSGKFLKSDGSGGVQWEEVTTLRPMREEWCGSDLTTEEAANKMFEDGVQAGEGYAGGVSWSDLYTATRIGNGEVKAFVINDWIIQFELTSSNVEPYAWFFNSAAGVWRSYVPLVDNLTTNDEYAALTAKQGKVLQDTKQPNLPSGQNDQYLHKNATTGDIEWSDVESGGGTETTTILESDLYTYTDIGKITGATQTNPKKVADAGQSLKDVFNAILGTEVDVNPTINQSGTTFTKSAQTGTTSVSGGEIGTAVAAQTGTVTFKVTNTAIANYGLKAGTYDTGVKKTIVNTTFNYPVLTRKINDLDYQICIAYPELNGCTLSVTAGTLVYNDTTNRKLYCNLNASNIVTISIAIPAGASTSAAQTRFGQLSADVSFGPAAYNGVAVDNFWTYLKAAYTASGMSHDAITGVKSTAYSITAGAYYPYYYQTDDATLPTTIAQSVATKSTDAVCYTNGADYTISKKYFYFLVPSAKTNKTIQQYVTGQWNNMNTTNDGTKTLTLNSGATASYKIYRTDELVPSTLKLRITT